MPPRVPTTFPSECGNKANLIIDDKPQITSPLRGVIYTIRLSRAETIALKANRGGQGPIYWFADNSFIAKSDAGTGVTWVLQQA